MSDSPTRQCRPGLRQSDASDTDALAGKAGAAARGGCSLEFWTHPWMNYGNQISYIKRTKFAAATQRDDGKFRCAIR